MAPKITENTSASASSAAAAAQEKGKKGKKGGAASHADRKRARSDVTLAGVRRTAARSGVRQLSRGAAENMRERILAAMGDHLRAAADVAAHCHRRRVKASDLDLVASIRARPAPTVNTTSA